jgi:hypothetical protein
MDYTITLEGNGDGCLLFKRQIITEEQYKQVLTLLRAFELINNKNKRL